MAGDYQIGAAFSPVAESTVRFAIGEQPFVSFSNVFSCMARHDGVGIPRLRGIILSGFLQDAKRAETCECSRSNLLGAAGWPAHDSLHAFDYVGHQIWIQLQKRFARAADGVFRYVKIHSRPVTCDQIDNRS